MWLGLTHVKLLYWNLLHVKVKQAKWSIRMFANTSNQKHSTVFRYMFCVYVCKVQKERGEKKNRVTFIWRLNKRKIVDYHSRVGTDLVCLIQGKEHILFDDNSQWTLEVVFHISDCFVVVAIFISFYLLSWTQFENSTQSVHTERARKRETETES